MVIRAQRNTYERFLRVPEYIVRVPHVSCLVAVFVTPLAAMLEAERMTDFVGYDTQLSATRPLKEIVLCSFTK